MSLRTLIVTALCLLAAGASSATDYHVGPGQPLATIGAVPWESLLPGDTVYIHWRATPYAEKWVLNRRGTVVDPIRVVGVRGPGGERPVIDGRDAATAPGLNFWNESRGVLKIGGSNTPPDGLPGYLEIEGLEIRSGRPPFTFTNDGGGTSSYSANAAAIYVEKAEHLTIRDCALHDSGNGLFIGAFDGATQNVLIEANELYDNGNVGSAFEHNAYTAGIGVTFQFNRFSALRSGADGNNLKDRSAGLVVRYNWIEDGNRQLDLVDAEDSQVLVSHPSYSRTWVYGNVLIESDGQGNSQIVHYGGDSGSLADYRKGTLHFWNNTVVSTRSGNTTLLRLSTNDEHADVRNNVLYVSANGSRLAMLNADGVLDLRTNWTKPGWVDSHSGLTGTIDDDGSGVESASPDFVDEGLKDFRLEATSAAVGEGGAAHPETLPLHPLDREYVVHLGQKARWFDGDLDLGAFERCPGGVCDEIFSDGFESGDLGAWSP